MGMSMSTYVKLQSEKRETYGADFLLLLHAVLEKKLAKLTEEEVEKLRRSIDSGRRAAIKIWEDSHWLGDPEDPDCEKIRSAAKDLLLRYLIELQELEKWNPGEEEEEDDDRLTT